MTDYKRIREVLTTIVEDMEADTLRREGQPFNGRTVAAALGELSATVAALANIVKALLPAEVDEPEYDSWGAR